MNISSMLYGGGSPALRQLSIFMIVLGVSFVVVLPFAPEVMPPLFRWFNPAVNIADEHMILSMYIALGICFIVAAKDPLGNAIIIDFTIISSVLHGLVMLYYSFALEGEHLHLAGDVPLLFVLAAGLAYFHPKRLAR